MDKNALTAGIAPKKPQQTKTLNLTMNENTTDQSTAVATTKSEKVTLKSLLKSPAYARRFEEVLGKRAPQFLASIIVAGNRLGPDCDPMSIIGAAMIAATLDLPIDPNLGFAHIVPYRDKGQKVAQFQIGYRGYIQLAQRTGQYAGMNDAAINIEAFGGWDMIGEPIIDWSKVDESKPVYGYVFAFRNVGGFIKVALWTKTRVEEHAKRYSKAFNSSTSAWKTNFDGMARKTVIANTLKRYGIMSVEINTALKTDQAVLRDLDSTPEFIDNESAISETVAPKIDTAGVRNELTGEAEDLPPMTKREDLLALMAKDGILEGQLIDYLQSKGAVEDSLSSLEDVENVDPSTIIALVSGWEGIAKNMKELRKKKIA